MNTCPQKWAPAEETRDGGPDADLSTALDRSCVRQVAHACLQSKRMMKMTLARRVFSREFCKLGSGISIEVQAVAFRNYSFFCSRRKDIFKYRVASIQFSSVSMASARINRRQLSRLGKIRTDSSADLLSGPMDSRSVRGSQ